MFLKSLNGIVDFKKTGLIFLLFFVNGCVHHTIAFQELHYDLPDSKRSENIIVVIDIRTLAKIVTIKSHAVGIGHTWDAQPGEMLKQAADIEFPQQFNKYTFSNSIIKPPWQENTFLLEMRIPDYQFKNWHAYFSVSIVVYNHANSILLEKTYRDEGISQQSKMVWAGAYGMKSAVRQSSLDALKKILKKIRVDLSNLLDRNPLELNYEEVDEYYSPQDSVDSFDEGEDEYYSPQDVD